MAQRKAARALLAGDRNAEGQWGTGFYWADFPGEGRRKKAEAFSGKCLKYQSE